jgi:hypothetical protein
VQRLEPALDRAGAQRRKRVRRRRKALELVSPEILELEKAPQQLSGAFGDDDAAGLGQRLQPRG